MTQAIATLSALAAIGSFIIAGVFFAFSTFVMTSLFRLPTNEGVAAMQSINRVILRSWFMPVFTGTAVVGVGLAVSAFFISDAIAMWALLIGSALYVVGTFVCTIVFNVPLNNTLDRTDAKGAAAGEVWKHYVPTWNMWNHVRTVASLLAAIALAVASARLYG